MDRNPQPLAWRGMVHAPGRALAVIGWLVGSLGSVQPAHAGWISEIQPAPRQVWNATHTGLATLPALIELNGLDPADTVELVVLNAAHSPTRRGSILQTITVPAGSALRVVTDGPWPADVWPFTPTIPGLITALEGGQSFDLDGPRSLWLFDQPTGLIPFSGKIQDFADQLAGVRLLDVVTLGPPGSAAAMHGEPVLTIHPAEVVARPMWSPLEPWDGLYLSGQPDLSGYLTGFTPPYQLTPALPSLTWRPLAVPEPGSAVLLLILGWLGETMIAPTRRRLQ